MSKVRKATSAEIAEYQKDSPVYPLSHWVKVGGIVCPVERLSPSHDDDPAYEIMLPAGFHARYEWLHSLLCDNLRDVADRARSVELEACGESCPK